MGGRTPSGRRADAPSAATAATAPAEPGAGPAGPGVAGPLEVGWRRTAHCQSVNGEP